jgi:hypothetical protein
VDVELHDSTGMLVASLFGEGVEKFLQCPTTKLMFYSSKVLKKKKIKITVLIPQNLFVTFYFSWNLCNMTFSLFL